MAQLNRRKRPRGEREAKPDEVLAWLLTNGYLVKQGDEYRMTLAGLRFTASKPPGVVTRYIPGAEPQT